MMEQQTPFSSAFFFATCSAGMLISDSTADIPVRFAIDMPMQPDPVQMSNMEA